MRLTLLVAMLATAFSTAAAPSISVGPLFDYVPAGSSNVLKRIRNTGDETAYVRVEVAQMQFDADGNVSEVAVDNAALTRNVEGAQGIIASPSRMIIAANGQQATRLVYRGSRDQEQYYRLRFIPVAPSAEEFSLDEEQAEEAKALTSAVRVFTGFGTVLFVAPENPRYDTRISATSVENHGNATIVLDDFRRCELAKPDNCTAAVITHVRPGRSHALQPTDTQFLRYDLREGENTRRIDSRR